MKNISSTICAIFVFAYTTGAALLMEEDFGYTPGSLTNNPLWSGSGASIDVLADNLDFLPPLLNQTGLIRVIPGIDGSVYRNFTSVTQGNVYYSALIRCVAVPGSAALYVTSLQASGSTGPVGRVDPLSLYVIGTNDGYQFGIRHTENDVSFAPQVLITNTVHFIVMKYLFGLDGNAQLYIDPVPGAVEPPIPDADSLLARDPDDAPTYDPSDLAVVGFRALPIVEQGTWDFDRMRIGTDWASVTDPGYLVISVQMVPEGAQFSAHGVPGQVYRVQTTLGLEPPVWGTVLSISAASDGLVQWTDTGAFFTPSLFYRLISP